MILLLLVKGTVEFKYISSHKNHELARARWTTVKNLPLPNSVKEEIQQQHAAGLVSNEHIMDCRPLFNLNSR